MHYVAKYEQRHPSIKDNGEAEMLQFIHSHKISIL